ncbi:MAG: ABC transporter permease [Anaerolineae bacterium]
MVAMLSPRWHKVLRDIWANKLRTTLVVLSIAVGVFAVGAIATTRVILDRDMTAAYLAINPAHASLYSDGFGDELVRTVQRMDGVADAQGRTSISVRTQVGPEQWKTLVLNVIPDYDDQRINVVRPMTGEWPPSKGAILVERESLAFLGTTVGETITVELPSGRQRSLLVSGSAHDINQFPPLFSGRAYGYITFSTFELLGGSHYFDQIDITVTGDATDAANIEAVAETVRQKIERGGRRVYFVYLPVPGEHPANQYIEPMVWLLGVLGLLSVLSGGFLVLNTVSALLTQQVRQIGMMKAIGARTGQVIGLYLGMVLVFGVLSLFIAVPLGTVGALGFSHMLASLVNFDLTRFTLPPTVLLLEVAVGLLAPLVAALQPVVSGTRITVREAISSYGLSRGPQHRNWLDRALERVRFLSRPLLLSLRNTFRRRGRLMLTLSTLVLGGSIFVGVFSVQASLMRTLDVTLAYWQYDVEIGFSRAYRAEQIEREALAVPGVVAAESWGFDATRRLRPDGTDSKEIYVIAPPADTAMLRPEILEGRWLQAEDENAIVLNTEITKNENDIAVGDEIVLKIDDRETTWTVVGIVRGVLTGPVAYANYPYFTRVAGYVGQAVRLQVVTDGHSPAYTAEVARRLEDHFESIGMRVGSTGTSDDTRQQVIQQFNLIVVFLLVMAVLLALVGGLGLMGTMSLNVLERTREIGVLRAVGASDGAILRIVTVEGLIIGVLSWVLGVIVAWPLSVGMSATVGSMMLQTPLTYAFSLGGAALWLAVVAVIAVLASLLPARNASRLSVREVLAYE